MTDIFLSYNREDQARAKLFADAFAAQGFKVWWDVGLRTGEAYDEVTETALRTAKAVVVLWSRKSVQSRWVRAEATLAERNKTLVPCMIEPCERPIMFELTQTAELSHWTGQPQDAAWQAFLADVTRFVGAPERPAPPPPAPGETIRAVAKHPVLAVLAFENQSNDPDLGWFSDGIAEEILAAVSRAPERPAPPPPAPGETIRAVAKPPVLAVLAFENQSNDPDLGWFSDGIAEEILAAVSRAPGVRVIGATSSFAFRGARKAEAAGALGATHVLDGSVRRGGNRVRISATLTEAGSGEVLWTERFDRELDDALAVQDEIAELTAAALQSKLRPAAPAAPVDPEAYDLYLRALTERRSSEDAAQERAIALLEAAVARAPGYARAHSALAMALGHRIRKATYADAAPEAFDNARAAVKAAADRALALDPEDIEARLALLSLEPVTETWAEQDRVLTEALAANPTDLALLWYRSRLLIGTGRFGDAARVVRLGYELSPLSPLWLATYSGLLLLEGNLEDADRLSHQSCSLDPLNPFVWYNRVNLLGIFARFSEARELLDSPPHAFPLNNGFAAWLDAIEKKDEESCATYFQVSMSLLKEFNFTLIQLISGLCMLGMLDGVFISLEKLIASAPSNRIWSMWNAQTYGPGTENLLYPFHTALHADPRFLPLCHRLGLCAYWAQSGHWPDLIADSPNRAALEARVRELAAA